MGALVNVYPGYQRVTDEDAREKFETAWGTSLAEHVGLTVVEMMNAACDGELKAMYVFGENPVVSDPDTNHVRACLDNLDLLVVQDLFLTETAELADVVLPAASFAEKDGTVTNTERRVQRLRTAVPPVGDAKPDWEILAELATRVIAKTGQEIAPDAPYGGWDYQGPSEIMDEIAALTPIYGGMAYRRLGGKGLQWPCTDADHPGTKILHVGQFSRGLGHFTGVEWTPPSELPDDDYPFILTTGRVLEHFHTGTMTHRVEGLEELVPEERARINVIDADRLGLADGDLVTVRSRRGEVKTRVSVGEESPPGVVFMTFHFGNQTANLLTNPALDPVAKIPEYKVCAVQVEPE
jgi:predicted molibdopterin-dependent oxidoreductase YjgC